MGRAFCWLGLAGLLIACSPKAPVGAPPSPCPCSDRPPPASEPAGATPENELPELAPEPVAEAAPRQVTLDHSEIVELDSSETGRRYELWVALPPSFSAEPTRTYPTLYLLDGQWDFSLVRALAGGLLFDKVAPEFLIVGITYGGEHPDYGALRAEDYLPTRATKAGETAPKGGDARKFLTFLEARVLPLVEARYRADPQQRILAGTSYGGLFTLFALFERPELFQTFLALSPAVHWDDAWIFAREAAFRRTQPRLERRIWLSVGTHEWPEYTAGNRAFFRQIQESHYGGATFEVRFIEGEAHAGNKPEAYNRALRFAFRR